jgi:hypothetical protein
VVRGNSRPSLEFALRHDGGVVQKIRVSGETVASHKPQAGFFVLELDFLFGDINSKLAGFQQAAKLIQNLNGF